MHREIPAERIADEGGLSAWSRASNSPVARPSMTVQIIGYVLAVWFLGFAAVNVWHLINGVPGREDYPEHQTVIVIMSVAVLLLKLAGAIIAAGAVRPRPRGSWLLAAATWNIASVLVVYSAGNLVFAAGMASGLMQLADAWTEAGGFTARLVAYVLFFLAGAVLASLLAVSVHRRHQATWSALAAGAVGAPVLLASLLALVPALLMAVT